MGEEQGLSAENRRLLERLGVRADFAGRFVLYANPPIKALSLNALLDAARSEGLQPPVGEVEEEVFSSLGASKAPSCTSAGVAETPSEGR